MTECRRMAMRRADLRTVLVSAFSLVPPNVVWTGPASDGRRRLRRALQRGQVWPDRWRLPVCETAGSSHARILILS
jgi:hypothetical protein